MSKIDRLGWAAGVSFEVFGLRIGIRVREARILDLLLARIPVGWTPLESDVVDRLYSVVTPAINRPNVRQLYVLYGDHGRLIRAVRFQELLDAFESDLDLHIAANSENALFVHAGAVSWNGHAIVIPGRSQTGKTTLVAEFLKSGAAYYSDDFAMIDRAGRLHPFPRELSIRTRNGTPRKVRPEELGASCAQARPISCVLVTEYEPGTWWSPEPVSRGRGMLSLLENTPSARKQPIFALEVLQRALANADVLLGRRGDKKQSVQQIQNYLDRRRRS